MKLQEVFKEHKNAKTVLFPETKHFKYRLCCPYFGEVNKFNNKFEYNRDEVQKRNNEPLLDEKFEEGGTYQRSEFTEVKLKIKYSLNNQDSILSYLKLQKNESPITLDQNNYDTRFKDLDFDLLTFNQKCIEENNDLIKSGFKTCSHESDIEFSYDCEEEYKKILSLNNGQLPKNLKVYLDHRYCRFGFKYSCDICKLSFPEEYLLKPHIEMCHIYPDTLNSSVSKYQCMECQNNFKTFIALREHLKLQHVWYKCKVCQKQFLGNSKFELHVKKNHSGYRPFQCSICGKLFKTKLLFFEHEKYTHENEKPYNCKICNKKWTNLINLDMHMRTHIGGRLLKCQDCDDSFDDADSLEQHRKLNHVMKKILHECDLCLAEFTNLGNLTKHMKTHKDYKAHCCVICDRRFPTLKHLKQHISIKHEEQVVLMCELCDLTYLNENDLMTHIEKHSGEI